MPVLVAEWLIGRRGQKNPVDTMRDLSAANGRSGAWVLLGASAVVVGAVILSFYSVVGGWSLYYTIEAGTGAFAGLDAGGVEALFNGMLASPLTLLLWHSAFMGATIAIVARGVTGGLEAAVRFLMPALAVLIAALVLYGMTTGHFGETLSYMFAVDLGRIDGSLVIAAMGQAFFTLSVGAGVMMAYGAYLGKETSLLSAAWTVVILDTVIALAAGLVIFPIVFANGLETSAGPGLIFVTLPIAFAQMAFGSAVGLVFFLLLAFAALTSAISLLEPAVAFTEQRSRLGRVGSTLAIGGLCWALGIAALLSFNLWSAPLPFVGLGLFDALDGLTSKIMLPLNGFFAVLFVGWFLNRRGVLEELGLSGLRAKVWLALSCVVAPLGVIAVFLAEML